MGETSFVLVLALVTFALVAAWMWRTKKKAEKGLQESKHE